MSNNMSIVFYIDPESEMPHIYHHGVYENEVEEILHSPIEEWQGKEDSKIAIGQTENGRYLQVIYAVSRKDPGNIFVITAYELKGKPLKAFKRRRRKKHED